MTASLQQELAAATRLVITASPGAGKSTLLPLAMLDAIEGKILMLEPRRLAARQIATRMASLIGEVPGQSVGYRIRHESAVSRSTRIEVLTEGILTRMLLDDPTLEGVGAVVFDEFHERSIHSDEALALTRQIQSTIREDLRIVLMSATMDTTELCRELDASLLEMEGRVFPVTMRYARTDTIEETVVDDTVGTIRRALLSEEGDILAFLPGEGHIRRCLERLSGLPEGISVCPLHGTLSFEEQRRALERTRAGERKIVLSTPIAETSLTIEGVRTVIDSGFCRRPSFDPRSSLGTLETVRISADMADQRSGRAGRMAPGVCYRLWTQATQERLQPCRRPEILDADLASLCLDLAIWGDEISTQWLTPPPPAAFASAVNLLKSLGALDEDGRITQHGCAIAALPTHPRIARMLIRANGQQQKALACEIAAILEDVPTSEDRDICSLIHDLRNARARGDRRWHRAVRSAAQLMRLSGLRENDSLAALSSEPDPYMVGALIAGAWPDRIARAHRDGLGKFSLSSGGTAVLPREDALASCEWIAVASLNARQGTLGKIFLAAPLDPADIKDLMYERDRTGWDSRAGEVVAERETRIGQLVFSSRRLDPTGTAINAICEAAAKEGLSMFDFSDEVENLQRRVSTLATWRPELELPDLSTGAVLATARSWLPPFIGKATTVSELRKIDLCEALLTLLSNDQRSALDRLAPTHMDVPTGSRIRLEYRHGAEAPVLRVRLQECFGMRSTPLVDGGRRPVLMELLSPGYKPVQLTSDLGSFWSRTYFEVRKELRRRYPKHSWPDNPLEAPATRRTVKK